MLVALRFFLESVVGLVDSRENMETTKHFFFKCHDPRLKVLMPKRQRWVQFEDVGNNVGVFITTKEDVASEFRDVAGRHISGVQEISSEEYNALKTQKKTGSDSSPVWREEFNPRRSQSQTHSAPVPSARPSIAPEGVNVAADDLAKLRHVANTAGSTPPPQQPQPTVPKMEQSQLPDEFKPVARRRKPKPSAETQAE